MRTPPLILIVEDNPASLDIFRARLEANGYGVITAMDGEAGLALAREKLPDLILLDIMMPKMDGLEVCQRIKNDSSLPFMPIIMLTAKADAKDVVAGLEAGSDEYLTKPVDHGSLVARVKSMLRIKELHDTVLDQSAQLKIQLETATRIQSLFWPKIPELETGGHIWAASVPATYVSGDLYDLIPLADGSLLAYVADVSDKGVPAALMMAALSTIIRNETQLQIEVDTLLETVNRTFYSLASEEGFFATIVMARYWSASGRMQVVSGGHLPPLLVGKNGLTDLPPLSGLSLGVAPRSKYGKQEVQLPSEASILFYSDGVTEAENEHQELFGQHRLNQYLLDTAGPPWGAGLIAVLDRWRGSAGVSDDITILEIWRDR